MAIENNVPIPLNDAIARPLRPNYRHGQDAQEGKITDPWIAYFDSVGQTVEKAPARTASVDLIGQSASIGATDLTDGTLSAGLYRLSYYTRITQAASTSSSLEITLDFRDGSQALSKTFAAITGNTLTTFQDGTLFFRSDQVAAVRYSTTYASVGATPALYRLDIILEEINA